MKNAQFLPKEKPSALNSVHSTETQKQLQLTPRECRVLDALLATNGWIPREEIDRIAGASNGPAVVMALRGKVTGQYGILMERVEVRDRDGLVARPGRYHLSAIGRFHARQARLGEAV